MLALFLISSCRQTPEMRSYSPLNLLFFHIAVSHNEFLNMYALFLNSSFCHLYQFQSFLFFFQIHILSFTSKHQLTFMFVPELHCRQKSNIAKH